MPSPTSTQAIGVTPSSTPQLTGILTVSYLNVGQADSEFIEFPDGRTMLIDAGNRGDGSNIAQYIKSKGYSKIDYLIATHPHADHIGGMAYIVNNLNIVSVYMPKITSTTETYKELITAINSKGLSIAPAKAGVSIINTADLKVYMIAANSEKYDELNDYSVVLKIIYKNNSFLFTGDAQTLSENEMISKGVDLKSDVLKVAHHGSDTSTGNAFLKAVAPKYSIISVGAGNDYGHPKQLTLNNLNAAGTTVYRTDKDGTVIISSDGTNLSVSTNSFASSVRSDDKVVPTPGATSGLATSARGVEIISVNKSAEIVTIKNNGTTDVLMSYWYLVSVTGNQRFVFPSCYLKAGASLTIASGGARGDFIWTNSDVWNNSKSDPAQLYDVEGKLISSFAS